MVAPLPRAEDCAVRIAHDQWTNNCFLSSLHATHYPWVHQRFNKTFDHAA
jgi:hypothetical protein